MDPDELLEVIEELAEEDDTEGLEILLTLLEGIVELD